MYDIHGHRAVARSHQMLGDASEMLAALSM